MRPTVFPWTIAVACLVGLLSGPARADQSDCDAAGASFNAATGACELDTEVTLEGTIVVGRTLHIKPGGKITVPPLGGGNTLTLDIAGDLIVDGPSGPAGTNGISGNVTTASGIGATLAVHASGDVLLRGDTVNGARITSDQLAGSCSGGRGGRITVAAGGHLTLEPGSAVTSVARCHGGEIALTGGDTADVSGLVLSEGTTSVGRGGPLTIRAGCSLGIGDSGQVVSRGRDPGADLVHLEAACEVVINGLVASTGPGHFGEAGTRCQPPNRPDKPAQSPACVEVWSGGSITIGSVPPHNGEVHADSAFAGGALCCAWIDLLARHDITINGDSAGPFSVHANQGLTNGFGGLVTVTSRKGNVVASGLAVEASATNAGGRGGQVRLQARGDVTVDDAQILAQGDLVATGGFGAGGSTSARAFNGALSWQAGAGGVASTGDVRPTGGFVPAAKRGTIALTHCAGIDTSGTAFPANGPATTPGAPVAACGGAPGLPDYVTFEKCSCQESGAADVAVVKTTSTPSVVAGADIRYRITVTAGGAAPSTGVTLTDTLPAGLAWTLEGSDAAACSIAAGTLTCAFGTLAPGDSRTVGLKAPTGPSHCGTISNTALVSADSDGDQANNSSGSVPIAIGCSDVSVVKTTSTPSIDAGEDARYSITVTAGGAAPSTAVTLTDTLPAGLAWTVGGADAQACAPSSPVAGGSVLTCNFGTLDPGASRTITLTAKSSTANCPALDNTAFVSSTSDTNQANNVSGPIRVTVACPVTTPDVSVAKTATTPIVTAGATASYRITVAAAGNPSGEVPPWVSQLPPLLRLILFGLVLKQATSTDVILTDTVPIGLTWTVGGADAGACSPASPLAGGTTLTCNFGTLVPGSTRTITLTAVTTAASCGTIANTAVVSSTNDTNSANNTAGPARIRVTCPGA